MIEPPPGGPVIEPLRVTLELDCPAEHAFTVWTARFGDWWPGSHTVSSAPGVAVHLEPRLGGRIYERAPDGSEHDWGEVTVWEPPVRLGYLWHLRRDRADATDVELSFVATGEGRCRLEIVHSGWERLGAQAETWRTANRGGWDGLLPHFVAAIDRPLTDTSLTVTSLTDTSLTDTSLTDTSLTDTSLTDTSLTDTSLTEEDA